MARALLVGCGCRGRELGRRLIEDGWVVRGTTRRSDAADAIEWAGIEPAVADPDRAATILDQIGDVSVIAWLMGSAHGPPEAIAAIHGPRLERVMERLVDTPVRGFVYEGAGSVHGDHLREGTGIVGKAGARWRIPVAVVEADPEDVAAWCGEMRSAIRLVTGWSARYRSPIPPRSPDG